MTDHRPRSSRLHGAVVRLRRPARWSPASTSSCTRARSWPCSGPTARASRRWCAASSACSAAPGWRGRALRHPAGPTSPSWHPHRLRAAAALAVGRRAARPSRRSSPRAGCPHRPWWQPASRADRARSSRGARRRRPGRPGPERGRHALRRAAAAGADRPGAGRRARAARPRRADRRRRPGQPGRRSPTRCAASPTAAPSCSSSHELGRARGRRQPHRVRRRGARRLRRRPGRLRRPRRRARRRLRAPPPRRRAATAARPRHRSLPRSTRPPREVCAVSDLLSLDFMQRRSSPRCSPASPRPRSAPSSCSAGWP